MTSNHFCDRDGSALLHLELRGEWMCMVCGTTIQDSEQNQKTYIDRE